MILQIENNKEKAAGIVLFLYMIIMFFTVTLTLTGCKSSPVKETRTGFYLNTVVSITLYEEHPDELFEGCMELIDAYDRMLSRTSEGSDIWNINHSNGAAITVHEETAELLGIALSYAKLSDGLVDPTIGTLSILWNFGDDNEGIVPSQTEIEEALSHVNYKNVILEGNQVTLKDPDARLDLGFIAKGYIADRVKEYLLSRQVTSAIINLGGNVLTIGQKPDDTPFKVGIQQPFSDTGTAALTLTIQDKSLVSSGNYERYFIKDDVLYHHILSTSDGYPVNSGLSGVTVISDHSVDGDALSTLCFILGYEKGQKLIDSLQNVEAVFIDLDGNIL
ncbi:MAG: FAD:protein FMN transferase [Suilimivivens sp.]